MLGKLLKSISGKVDDDPVLSVDIGSDFIKVVELDPEKEEPTLLSVGVIPTPPACFTNNVIDDPTRIGQAVRSAVDANGIKAGKVVTAVSGPASFSKCISTSITDPNDLRENISFEASNYIPHNINNVFIDYQVLGKKGTNALELLIVAVKNDVVEGYVKSIEAAGLEPIIVDVDSYALENMFELNYPEESSKVTAVLNIGSKFTSVNIQHGGRAIFKGEVGVGGKQYTTAIAEALGVETSVAEAAKKGSLPEGVDPSIIRETIEATTEQVAIELERQIGFFWGAAETESPVETIFLSGGGSLIPGLLEELNQKTGVETKQLDALKNIKGLDSFEASYLKEISPSIAISIGLASRKLGDKLDKFNEEAV